VGEVRAGEALDLGELAVGGKLVSGHVGRVAMEEGSEDGVNGISNGCIAFADGLSCAGN
jgi:hypothetical protein